MVALASSRFPGIPAQFHRQVTIDSVSRVRSDVFWRPRCGLENAFSPDVRLMRPKDSSSSPHDSEWMLDGQVNSMSLPPRSPRNLTHRSPTVNRPSPPTSGPPRGWCGRSTSWGHPTGHPPVPTSLMQPRQPWMLPHRQACVDPSRNQVAQQFSNQGQSDDCRRHQPEDYRCRG